MAAQNVQIGVVGGAYGSLKVIGNVTIRWSAYDYLFDFNRNHASILYRFRDIASYLSPILTHPPAFGDPAGGRPRSNFAEIFGTGKLESLGYRVVLFV